MTRLTIHQDKLDLLIQHLEEEADIDEDIKNIAAKVQKYLLDQRFETLPPEVIYKIVLTADNSKLEQSSLIAFTMKMFQISPSRAVPLVMLIDFDRLTFEQRETIFENRQMHELSIGFFIAQSMSHATNKISRSITNESNDEDLSLADIRSTLREQVNSSSADVENRCSSILRELEEKVKKSQIEIDALMKQSDSQHQNLKAALDKAGEDVNLLHKRIEDLHESANGKTDHIRQQGVELKDQIVQELTVLQEELQMKVDESKVENDEKCKTLDSDILEKLNQQKKRFEAVEELRKAREQDLKETAEEVSQLQSLLAAKIIKDELRFDNLVRKTENRFNVFTEEDGLWNLSPEEVKEAERQINRLELKIDQACPLRKSANQEE